MSEPNPNLRNVRSFLTRAAYDDEFRAFLQTGSPDEVGEHLRDRYGVDIKVREKRKIPPKEFCKELLTWSCWAEEYAAVEITDAVLDAIFFVVGYAMPLVITAEDVAVAAG